MESWVQLPPAHGYTPPRTMKVRGHVQSMVSTCDGRDWTYRAMRVAAKSAHSRGDRGRTPVVVGQGG